MKNYTVITDPGIDDLIALVLLHKLQPSATNCLVSTFGNATEAITAHNAKEFISFVAPKWQFMHGASNPFNNIFEHPWPDYFHGPDAVWSVHPQVDTSKIVPLTSYPPNQTIISLATLSDLYKIQQKEQIEEVIIMGGVFDEKGNETTYAETNISFDPDAAHLFFSKCKNNVVKVVPLNVTRKVFWTEQNIDSIPEKDETNLWLKTMIKAWFKNYSHQREKNLNLHDPLAVYLSHFPKNVKWTNSGIKVITNGKQRGQTVFSNVNSKCKIAMELINPSDISKKIYDLTFN